MKKLSIQLCSLFILTNCFCQKVIFENVGNVGIDGKPIKGKTAEVTPGIHTLELPPKNFYSNSNSDSKGINPHCRFRCVKVCF